MNKVYSMDKNNRNSISLIRILAAFQVMLGHIFEHLDLCYTNYSYIFGVSIYIDNYNR